MKTFYSIGYKLWYSGLVITVLSSYAWLWYSEGFEHMWEIARPGNVINTMAILLSSAPGYWMLTKAAELERREAELK